MIERSTLWGVYWRYLIAVAIVFFTVVVVAVQLPFLSLIENSRFHPMAFWLMVMSFALLFTLVAPPGVIRLLFGYRLNLSPQIWRQLNFSFVGLFLLLALMGLLAQGILNTSLWGYYKLYLQPMALVTWPLVASWRVLSRNWAF